METLKLFCYIFTMVVLILFYGIPSLITGIKELADCYYPKWLCIIFIIMGILMCFGAPCLVWLCC